MIIQKQKLEKAAYILKTIAHPTRLAVIQLLDKNGKMGVNDICKKLQCEQSLISHHLSNMRIKGLLSAQREGTSVFYSLKEKELLKIMSAIEKCDCNM
jgi:ArsR family transcriptional regulator